jgi:hypothetical protein
VLRSNFWRLVSFDGTLPCPLQREQGDIDCERRRRGGVEEEEEEEEEEVQAPSSASQRSLDMPPASKCARNQGVCAVLYSVR